MVTKVTIRITGKILRMALPLHSDVINLNVEAYFENGVHWNYKITVDELS